MVDPNIKKKADDIRTKIKGKEVREALASGIEDISEDVVQNEGRQGDVEQRQSTVESRQTAVENRFDDQIAGNTDIDEVIDARRPEGKEAYPTLRRRLDEEHQEVTAQLAQTGVNVKTFGAKGDGVTDDVESIREAIDFAITSGLKKVLIPSGEYILKDNIRLTSYHNGLQITGNGASSILKLADHNVGWSLEAGWMFDIRDESADIKDISIKNIKFDGNRYNSSLNTTSYGIRIYKNLSNISQKVENVLIENVWTTRFRTSGLQILAENVMVNNVYSWDNFLHGVGVGAESGNIVMNNLNCYDNGGYGIDISSGEAIVDNFVCRDNAYGIKTSTNARRLILTNGLIINNENEGFTQTGQADELNLIIDNVESSNNGSQGFRIVNGSNIKIGKIIAIGNGRLTQKPGIQINRPFTADSISIKKSYGDGLSLTPSSENSVINNLIVKDCNGWGVDTGAGLDAEAIYNLTIKSGEIAGNLDIGIHVRTAGCYLRLSNVIFSQEGSYLQNTSINFSGVSGGAIEYCDFLRNSRIEYETHSEIAFMNNSGYRTQNHGVSVQSGNGMDRTFTIDHGLVTPSNLNVNRKLNVIPSSSDASGKYTVTVDTDVIRIVYDTPPQSGTDNLKWYWDTEFLKIRS